MCGTIQPRVLARAIGTTHKENGLLARLLLAMPPRITKKWTAAEVDPAVIEGFGLVIDGLLGLEPAVDDDGIPAPIPLELSTGAKRVWTAFYNRHAVAQRDLEGDLAAAFAKLEEAAARLALVVHLTRWAGGDPTADPQVVDEQSMRAGVTLAEWFKGEVVRVYRILGETDGDRDRRRLVEWIRQRGGETTVRDLQRGPRQYRAGDAAEAALADLVKRGFGYWVSAPPGKTGGQPARVFRLATLATGDRTPINPRNNEVVSPSPVSPSQKTLAMTTAAPPPPEGGDTTRVVL